MVAEPTVTLVPGPAEVAVNNLNVRGQAGLKGEVVAHLFKGDTVTVLDQINLRQAQGRMNRRSGPKSPSRRTPTSGSTPNTLTPTNKTVQTKEIEFARRAG